MSAPEIDGHAQLRQLFGALATLIREEIETQLLDENIFSGSATRAVVHTWTLNGNLDTHRLAGLLARAVIRGPEERPDES